MFDIHSYAARLCGMQSPPEPTLAQRAAAAERDERQRDEYERCMAVVLRGAGPFWNKDYAADCWDTEQEFVLFRALGRVLAMNGLSDAERWGYLIAAVSLEGGKWAAHMAEKTR